jgi:molybdopterin-guanine dinucleotide biosynthesis protein
MRIRVVCINGYPESGKTTFVQMCLAATTQVHMRSISTVDHAKEALRAVGWDGETKCGEVRQALHDIKVMSNQLFNDSEQYVKKTIYQMIRDMAELKLFEGILFVDSREPAELEKFQKEVNACILLIRRPREKTTYQNEADQNVLNFKYDQVIVNDGSLDDLRVVARNFVKAIHSKLREEHVCKLQ